MSSSRVLSSASARGPRTMPPGVEALFTSTSRRPNAVRVASTRWATDSELIVSATTGMMRRPVSCVRALAASSRAWRCRAQMATSTPSDARAWAIARPMPRLPPVTIATRPASPRSIVGSAQPGNDLFGEQSHRAGDAGIGDPAAGVHPRREAGEADLLAQREETLGDRLRRAEDRVLAQDVAVGQCRPSLGPALARLVGPGPDVGGSQRA